MREFSYTVLREEYAWIVPEVLKEFVAYEGVIEA